LVGASWGLPSLARFGQTTTDARCCRFGARVLRQLRCLCNSPNGDMSAGEGLRIFTALTLRGVWGPGAAGCVRGSCSAAEVGGQRSGGGGSSGLPPELKPPSRENWEKNQVSKRKAWLDFVSGVSRGRDGRPFGVVVSGRRSWPGKLRSPRGGIWRNGS
jgi:hypothetical protein